MATERFVDSSDGVRIAVYEAGQSRRSHVGSGARLARLARAVGRRRAACSPIGSESWRTTTGVSGASSVPKPVSAYAMPRFADDFEAVIGELRPGTARSRAGARLGLGRGVGVPVPRRGERSHRVVHFGVGTQRRSLTLPSSGTASPAPVSADRGFVRALEPGATALLLDPFSIPVLAPRSCAPASAGGLQHAQRAAAIPVLIKSTTATYKPTRQLSEDLPRQRLLSALWLARRDHYVDVPVQLIVNAKDPVVLPYGYDFDIHAGSPRLWRRDIEAGHWSPISHAAGSRAVGARTRRLPRRQAAQPGAVARTGRTSARILRRHIGFRDRRGQRYRPRDRARVRP